MDTMVKKQKKIVMVKIEELTRTILKDLRITKRESYDEVINRLIDSYEEDKHKRKYPNE